MSANPSSSNRDPVLRTDGSSYEIHRRAMALRDEAIDQLWRDLGAWVSARFGRLTAKRRSRETSRIAHCG
ncbi:MAG: hypothetical protein KAY46_00165 [Burkholderiaceae bacterium]|nr:hypothetical protein [Burkholderiaceae bacterium]